MNYWIYGTGPGSFVYAIARWSQFGMHHEYSCVKIELEMLPCGPEWHADTHYRPTKLVTAHDTMDSER